MIYEAFFIMYGNYDVLIMIYEAFFIMYGN